MEKDKYFEKRMKEEKELVYKLFQSPKAIFLSIITGGIYYIANWIKYAQHVGII